jgi:hypothetical protein
MKKLLVVLLVAALMLGWGLGARQAEAGAPQGTVDLYIEVATAGCDTDVGPTTCNVNVGTSFMVTLQFKSKSGLNGTGGYIGWQARLTNSLGMPYQDRPGTAEIVWGQGVFPVDSPGVDTYIAGDVTSILPPFPTTNYLGPMMEVDYDCTTSPSAGHTITLVHGQPADTHIVDEFVQRIVDGGPTPNPDEVLTINCVEPPLPTPLPTPPPPPPPPVGGIVETLTGGDSPAEGSASSSSDYTLAIAAAAAGAVLALAVGGWYVRRRWLS